MNLQKVCIKYIENGRAFLEGGAAKISRSVLPESSSCADTATNCFKTLDGDVFSLTSEGGNLLPENIIAPLQKIISGNMSSERFQHAMLESGFSPNAIIDFFRSKIASVKGFTKATNALELAQKGKFGINEGNLWVLYKDDIFSSFLRGGDKNGAGLRQFLQSSDCYSRLLPSSTNSLPSLVSISERNTGIRDAFASYKKSFGVDLTMPQKVYRFIGDEELRPLLTGETVQPRFYRGSNILDVTLNPELNHNSYRVTFNHNSRDTRISPSKPEFYYYHSKGGYSLGDVSAIDSVLPEGYLRIKTARP